MTITLKASVIRFTLQHIKSKFRSSFDITSDYVEEDILFFQLVVLFLMKKTKKRKRKEWVWELFREREENRGFNNLIQEIKLADTESFLG